MVFTSFEYLFLFLPIACLLMLGFTRLTPETWGGGTAGFNYCSEPYLLCDLENRLSLAFIGFHRF